MVAQGNDTNRMDKVKELETEIVFLLTEKEDGGYSAQEIIHALAGVQHIYWMASAASFVEQKFNLGKESE